MGKKAKATVEAKVFLVEQFDVTFVGDDPYGGQYVEDYPYAKAANGGWTVKKWRDTRWASAYPGFDVEVLDGDGQPVHGKTLLRTVRDSYVDEYEYEEDEVMDEEVEASDTTDVKTAKSGEPPQKAKIDPPGPASNGSGGKTGTVQMIGEHQPTAEARQLVDKLWNFCHLLRDDGVSTIDYTEQLTFLLFLKMAHERETRPLNPEHIVPAACSWQRLLDTDGDELEATYRHMLEDLGKQPGTLGVIFRKAQNKIQDPAKLKRLIVDLIDKENWSATGVDIKGDAYEGLLAKGAEDIKSGAGQYFTPRALIAAMVDCVQPTVADTVVDPACGTGGFLLAAYEYASRDAEDMTPDQRDHLRDDFVRGTELVDGTARLAAMNMILHGMGRADGPSPIDVKDSLTADPGTRWSVVLANPPFGTKSSVKMIGEDGSIAKDNLEIVRDDFWVTTSNKQLNFVQHIKTILAINGRSAVVLPDNVLFEGGAGETLRKRLLREFDVHTLLRLPTGIFYAGGVKANVLFFDKRPAAHHPWTEKLWVYDFRTNQHFTMKQNPLRRSHLQEFVEDYKPGKPRGERVESERFKAYTYDELIARDKANLDLIWLKDDSLEDAADLPAPEILAREIVEELEVAIGEFTLIMEALELTAD